MRFMRIADGDKRVAICEMINHTAYSTLAKLLRNCARNSSPPRRYSLNFFDSGVADDRATTASTTRFRIVVCGRSTSPKRKVACTRVPPWGATVRCLVYRYARDPELQVDLKPCLMLETRLTSVLLSWFETSSILSWNVCNTAWD